MRLTLLLYFCLWFFGQAKAQQIVAPADWQPSLTLVRQELETQIKEAKSQETVFRLTSRLHEVAEAELFSVYIRLYEQSSSAARVALWCDEAQWDETYRNDAGDHTYLVNNVAAVIAGNRDIIHFIDSRTEKLRQRLSYLQRHRSRPNHSLQRTLSGRYTTGGGR